MNENHHLRARLYVLALACITGSNYLVMKITVSEIPPLSLIFWRFLFASVFLLAFIRGNSELSDLRLWRDGGIIGALLGLALMLLALAIQSAGSGETAFWVSSDAAFVPLILFLRSRELPPRKTLGGILLALVGLGLLSLQQGFEFRAGSIVGILSAATFAVWIIGLAGLAKRYSAVTLGMVQMLAALALTFFAAIAFGELRMPSSGQGWLSCIYLGAIGTGVRFAVQSHLQRTVSPTDTALIYLIEPVFAALLGLAFLGELLSMTQLIGCLLILCGIAVSQITVSQIAVTQRV